MRDSSITSNSGGRKVALITGAGSGIGRASAHALYQAGYALVLAGRRLAPLQETAQGWDEPRYLLVVADVSNADQVKDLFEQAQRRFGRLDVLFNNAGIVSPPLPLEQVPPSTFQQVMDTNVTGTFLCSQQAWTIMKAQGGGRIINNGSISAQTPRPLSLPYTTAKHAITGLTKSLNLDGRAVGICCSQIDIGNAETPMTERLATMGALQPNGATVVEPRMSVEVVAKTVVYLANLGLDVNVPFMTIMATQMPFMGRG